MSVRGALVGALLVLGVGLELLAVLGMVAAHDVFDRLHFLAPAALGGMLLSAAVIVQEGPSLIGLKAILLAAFLLGTSPVMVHVVARSIRISRFDDWRRQPQEAIRMERR